MVAVLLAVYNGERYLKQQIDSILNQSYTNVKIIIRDDGSTDNSTDIIKDYCKNYPEKIILLEGKPTGSAAKNFAELLKTCDDSFDYIMFCDQDDVWLLDKIEKTLAAMKSAEGESTEIPVLVHTDLKVADCNLNVINESFFKFQKLNQKEISLPKLLVKNYVTGCTVMINKALRQRCVAIPYGCIMHDWWLALTAELFGKLICLPQPTILYRQHENNQVGAAESYGLSLIKAKLKTMNIVRNNYNATYNQAKLLLDCYGDSLNSCQKDLITKYYEINQMNKLKKIITVNKYGFKRGTLLRNLGQYILM